jgi:broad specificity phosphatase PhoE
MTLQALSVAACPDEARRFFNFLRTTHGAVIRCAVVQALRAPIEAVWHFGVAYGSVTELHVTGSSWRVRRVGCLL